MAEYTDDVETLAERMAAAVGSRVFQPLHDEEIDRTVRDEYRVQARAVLDALAADGRLLPAGGETREEWGARWPDDVVEGPFASRQAAEEHEPCVPVDLKLVGRTVITWPDGTTLTGPWTPEDDDG